jgi:phosphatidylinositol dimannoside acyltransferase
MSGLAELGFSAAWRVVRTLPAGATWPVFAGAAAVAARRRGRGVARLAANLHRVVGPDLPDADLDALVRRAVRSYARYWQEVFRLPAYTREELGRRFHLYGHEQLAAAVEAGTGAVVALPHGGNWDAAGAWVAAQGWPITTVAERLKPEGVYERFLAFRRALGMEIIPLTGGERPPLEILAERLESGVGAVVPLLADRDLSHRGVDVRFFGGRTKMPPGPALLALRTGAPLYVAHMWYEPDRPVAQLDGPIEIPADGPLDVRVREVTQRVADRLAAGIARHPEDWHMLQRVWLTTEQAEQDDRTAPAPAV